MLILCSRLRGKALLLISILSSPLGAGAAEADDAALERRLLTASPAVIAADDELEAAMNARAEAAIEAHCADCHGRGLEGGPGVPDLVDQDWLWGVTGLEMTRVEPVMAIMQTILYGVRNRDCPDDIKRYGGCPDTRYSEMPAYGEQGFSQAQISDLTEYVLSLGRSASDADEAAVSRAESLWPVCTECHGDDGRGYQPFGGPNLRDDIWLYGGSREEISDVISNGRAGTCPAWYDTLDPATIKALAVYIYNRAYGL